jgi:hypothetical protein
MPNAIAASTGRGGTLINPGMANCGVILWATGSATMVLTRDQPSRTISSNASTYNR